MGDDDGPGPTFDHHADPDQQRWMTERSGGDLPQLRQNGIEL